MEGRLGSGFTELRIIRGGGDKRLKGEGTSENGSRPRQGSG